jgi:hypothetical protein
MHRQGGPHRDYDPPVEFLWLVPDDAHDRYELGDATP